MRLPCLVRLGQRTYLVQVSHTRPFESLLESPPNTRTHGAYSAAVAQGAGQYFWAGEPCDPASSTIGKRVFALLVLRSHGGP
jgi:hypothetical protein